MDILIKNGLTITIPQTSAPTTSGLVVVPQQDLTLPSNTSPIYIQTNWITGALSSNTTQLGYVFAICATNATNIINIYVLTENDRINSLLVTLREFISFYNTNTSGSKFSG